jgi:hypothetical protein
VPAVAENASARLRLDPSLSKKRFAQDDKAALSDSGTPFLFGLAPCGVCPARDITAAAVRSYRTFSPLPRPSSKERYAQQAPARTGRAVCFLWHFPSGISHSCKKKRARIGHPSRTLSGTVLCGVRTFLPAHSDRASRNPSLQKRSKPKSPGSKLRQNGRSDRPVRLPTNTL